MNRTRLRYTRFNGTATQVVPPNQVPPCQPIKATRQSDSVLAQWAGPSILNLEQNRGPKIKT
jgi:hypothetical protein